jgi:hypothetical protein
MFLKGLLENIQFSLKVEPGQNPREHWAELRKAIKPSRHPLPPTELPPVEITFIDDVLGKSKLSDKLYSVKETFPDDVDESQRIYSYRIQLTGPSPDQVKTLQRIIKKDHPEVTMKVENPNSTDVILFLVFPSKN